MKWSYVWFSAAGLLVLGTIIGFVILLQAGVFWHGAIWVPGAILVPILLGGFRARAVEKSRTDDNIGGCVSCGSTNLQVEDGIARCLDCGYLGRADRGGAALTTEDLGASFERDDHDFWD